MLFEKDLPELVEVHVFAVYGPIKWLRRYLVEYVISSKQATVLHCTICHPDPNALAVQASRLDDASWNKHSWRTHVFSFDILEICVVLHLSRGTSCTSCRGPIRLSGCLDNLTFSGSICLLLVNERVSVVVGSIHFLIHNSNALGPRSELVSAVVGSAGGCGLLLSIILLYLLLLCHGLLLLLLLLLILAIDVVVLNTLLQVLERPIVNVGAVFSLPPEIVREVTRVITLVLNVVHEVLLFLLSLIVILVV